MELKNYMLKQVVAQGMKPIRQVELYTKWRKCVLADIRDNIAQSPQMRSLQMPRNQVARRIENRE